ncbi:MAG: restriction endonuclease subunit S, partial [Bryobacteraceae bacterium]
SLLAIQRSCCRSRWRRVPIAIKQSYGQMYSLQSTLSDFYHGLLDHRKCLPDFLHAYFLHHPIAQKYLAKRAKGSIMEGLNMGIIERLPLLLPLLARQKVIVTTLDALRTETQRLESIYQQKLSALDALKKSLLHQAFSGEL